ncbi:hypothetical protein NY547_09590 [Cnuibacter physcomitrellae]|uniref:hypothetical protein n=1 Tax=Cnuibacter physcomitrellae TaxID=1619308 RepID=UPI0021757A89|nr:hypothetical protein [Cnuibacter physcomitrellae]MCS5497489.1 hypothetical protein [Cnuibacter physcomitrellae]
MGDLSLLSLLPSVVVFGVAIAVFVLLVVWLRRRMARIRSRAAQAPAVSGAPRRQSVEELERRAGIQLVQMDDAISEAQDELGFAVAEFGEAETKAFAEALETARRRSSEAFALKQRLDDAMPDTEQQRRDWSNRIVLLADSAVAAIAAQSSAFERRRRAETAAPAALDAAERAVAVQRERLPLARTAVTEAAAHFAATAVQPVAEGIDRAEHLLDQALQRLQEARTSLAADPLAPVSRQVAAAESDVRRAERLLDAGEGLDETLAVAQTRLDETVADSRRRLDEAARIRETATDPGHVAAITAAMTTLSSAIVPDGTLPDPVRTTDVIATATTALDAALAVARSASQRIEAARDALAGAQRIAESHIATAAASIDGSRGRVGVDARTRLAEARRQLDISRDEADPVAALDAARRAATAATDADALAVYDATLR